MERDKIIFLRNFFFCAFITGVVFALFYVIATYVFWETATQWVAQFYKVDEKEFGRMCSHFSRMCDSWWYFCFSCRLWLCIGWPDGNSWIVKKLQGLQSGPSDVTL